MRREFEFESETAERIWFEPTPDGMPIATVQVFDDMGMLTESIMLRGTCANTTQFEVDDFIYTVESFVTASSSGSINTAEAARLILNPLGATGAACD